MEFKMSKDQFFRDLFDPSGIYAAIDTYDMGNVVQEAIKAITHKSCISSALTFDNFVPVGGKSEIKSREARMSGNECYKAGKMKEATQFYNKALALAPKFSKEMILAYSNRSAVFFYKRYISGSLKDIQTCLSLGCTGSLAEKLTKRREDATPLLFLQITLEMTIGNDFIDSFLRVNDCNAQVPCVRSDVTFETDSNKIITARAEIKVGSVVGIEKAFVAIPNNSYIACYYCNKPEMCLDPCEGCQALFCGERCREQCLKEYHCVECQIADLLGSAVVLVHLAARAAIKMSLKVTWDEFISASTVVGASRMKASTAKQAFNCDEPLSLLCYIENEPFMEGKMYNGSLIFAAILLRLIRDSKHYFPKEKDKREAAVIALGRVMLQLYVTFSNGIDIQSSACNVEKNIFEGGVLCSQGWFSMSSKIRHSCEPNLFVMGLNNSIALIALKNIKQGEELTISYDGVYYDHPVHYEYAIQRMNYRFLRTRKMCEECRVCSQNWNRNVDAVEMTRKQAKLFEKLTNSSKNINYEHFRTICDVLNSFSYNSAQHLTAYEHLRGFLNIIQSKSCNNYTFS